ncbi:MAG: hypothetical protein E7223_02960 [Clostridiales bacterium]|nr:hypothetical protein [Clostridiales bacterium]
MKKSNRRTSRGVSRLAAVCAVVLLAVTCGYLCSRFFLVPLLTSGTETDVPPVPVGSENRENREDPEQTEIPETPEEPEDPKHTDEPKEPEKQDEPGKNETTGPAEKTGTRYVIQYGCFSTKEGAEERKRELAALGIETVSSEVDGAFKLYGDPCHSESAIRVFLEQRKAAAGADIFITVVEADRL